MVILSSKIKKKEQREKKRKQKFKSGLASPPIKRRAKKEALLMLISALEQSILKKHVQNLSGSLIINSYSSATAWTLLAGQDQRLFCFWSTGKTCWEYAIAVRR